MRDHYTDPTPPAMIPPQGTPRSVPGERAARHADPVLARGDTKPTPPPMAPGIGTIARIPFCDTSNPADLEAWFGNFGYADHFRKVVLASCKEITRAKSSEKLTEAKLDDAARVSDTYVDFLIQCLNGRRLREQNVLESNRNGAR